MYITLVVPDLNHLTQIILLVHTFLHFDLNKIIGNGNDSNSFETNVLHGVSTVGFKYPQEPATSEEPATTVNLSVNCTEELISKCCVDPSISGPSTSSWIRLPGQ